MKKITILFCILIAAPFSIKSQESAEFVHDTNTLVEYRTALAGFIATSMQGATPEQWQLLANSVVLSLTRAQLEIRLQKLFNALLQTLWTMREDNRQQRDISSESLNDLSNHIKLLITLIKDEYNVINAHSYTMQLIEDPANVSVRTVIEAMAEDTTNFINRSCQKNTDHIHTIIEQLHATLDSSVQKLHVVRGTAHALADNAFPGDFKEEENDSVILTIANNLVNIINANLQQLYEAGLAICKTTNSVQEAGLCMFYVYYQTIYNLMQEQRLDDRYFTFMVNKDGIIHDPALRTSSLPIAEIVEDVQ